MYTQHFYFDSFFWFFFLSGSHDQGLNLGHGSESRVLTTKPPGKS